MSHAESSCPLLTLDEAAERLSVSRSTIRRRIDAGEIPALQLGGPRTAVRIDAGELENWLYSDSPTTPTRGGPERSGGKVEPSAFSGAEAA
jgi:excisionase family DNA binding protein